MEMPTPGDAHKKLEILAGRWVGIEIMHPSPWDPAGGEAKGIIENRVALGGFVVIQDYTQERGGEVSFTGHGVFSWDAESAKVVLAWHDSMGMPSNTFVGDFDGDRLNLHSKSPMGDSRTSFDFSEPGKYTFKMEMSADGTNWTTMMDGAYARD